MAKKLNSRWRKGASRNDPKIKTFCEMCETNHSYETFVHRHAREGTGWRNGARVLRR